MLSTASASVPVVGSARDSLSNTSLWCDLSPLDASGFGIEASKSTDFAPAPSCAAGTDALSLDGGTAALLSATSSICAGSVSTP